MSDRQTFTDPETGEEVESTRLARGIVRLVVVAFGGIFCGLVMGLFAWLVDGLFTGLLVGLGYGLMTGVFFGLVGRLNQERNDLLLNRIHDTIGAP